MKSLPVENKSVVLGVTGGIAAYKACEIVSRLRKRGAEVYVIMTKNACRFVSPLTFETLSNHPVVTDTFDRPETWEVEHIALAKRADLFLIAPATANIMAKLASGIADDMLSTTALATKAPILLAPAMNTGMWTADATKENVKTLQKRGVMLQGPDAGLLACGDTGAGRMTEPAEIVDKCVELLTKEQDMKGLNVLVTAGPTREAIDPVRYISNRSSGKMGYAIADAAQKRGAKVTLVSGPVSIAPPENVQVISVTSTKNLYDAMMAHCAENDIVIQAAAPADYRVRETADHKLKKQDNEGLVLDLVPNEDVAKAVGERKRTGQTLVGFAAETEAVSENAQKKLTKKHLDLIVANDVTAQGAGFDVDTNIVTFITKENTETLPMMTKAQLGDVILDKILSLRA